MHTNNRRDLRLESTATLNGTAAVTGAVVDLEQEGGLDEERLVLFTDAAATLVVEGCATPDGTFRPVISKTADAAGEAYRERLPLACPRYIRLQATGSEASAAGKATLSIRM